MKKLLALTVLTFSTTFASTIAMITSGGGVGSNNTASFTTGWDFTAFNPITITSLGYYDADEDGLENDHEVGIFDSTGTLLVSVMVPSGTSSTLTNGFRMVSITPFSLAAGDYVIGGASAFSNDGVLVPGTMTTDPAISITDAGVYEYGASLVFPGTSTGGVPYASVNFEFTEVPEPSTVLLSFGALTAVGLKKRFSKQA